MEFKGVVRREFVDRRTKRYYPVGSVYTTISDKRVREIIAAGHGRGVVYVEFELPADFETERKLEDMTVAELRAHAEEIGLQLAATKKADIIAEIKAFKGD